MTLAQQAITLHLPSTLAFGNGCAAQCASDLARRQRHRRVFLVTGPHTKQLADPIAAQVRAAGAEVFVYDAINAEPTVCMFHRALVAAREARADAVIGIGGGSALDVAKLVAGLLRGEQDVRETFGIGKLAGRSTYLACLPTTAGTGSEVSPNAILLDEQDELKKGVISPHLVPDAAYVDPMLTLSMPPAITAATGMDALTHCIEAYANRFAHPLIDIYALEGIRLIARHLARAVEQGTDIDARTHVALGSMYGGLCLGPVNTGAVHALAYPLGGEFHIAHGVSNAVLLPHVLEFNLPAALERYAGITDALVGGTDILACHPTLYSAADSGRGVPRPEADKNVCPTQLQQKAERAVALIRDLSRRCGIPQTLRELGIPRDAIPRMAKSAMTVTRLLERNVRTVTEQDAIDLYNKAF